MLHSALTIEAIHGILIQLMKSVYKKPKSAIYSVAFFFIIVSVLAFLFMVNRTLIEASQQKVQVLGVSKAKKIPTVHATPTPTSTPIIAPQNNRTVYLGMWTQGFWNDSTKVLSPAALQATEQQIGKKVAIAHYYRGWQYLDSPAFLSELETINKNGWRPMVSANPYYFDKCMVQGKTLYRMIADGHCDAFLHAVGKNLKAYNKPVFLRFAWEMNIDSIGWGMQKTGSSAQDYVDAWRRFHTIVREEGASNVLWVFNPNTITANSTSIRALYPGDAYVDWLGLDGYNWGTTQSWSSWQTFAQVFLPSYGQLTAISSTKPVMLGEVNTTNQGGDKAAWYTDMLLTQIPYNYSRIQAVVFYNEDRTATEKVNWQIDDTTQSLNAFRNGIKSPTYLSSF